MSIVFNDFKKEVNAREVEYQDAINRVLSSGWYILGPEVKAFEDEFARYTGAKHAIGVANGLEALHISLMALGIGEGDEVITTPLSAVATTLAILAVGATPVFVDVTPDGLLDTTLIEPAITSKTKAILPVHLYGNSANLDELQRLSEKHGLILLEDAAQAHGSSWNGKKLGTIGALGCFSFYPTKNLGCFGDGGLITTNDEHLAQVCREIRDYGQHEKYVHSRLGLNSRLDELQAAVLRVKLRYLEADNHRRQVIAAQYDEAFSSLSELHIIRPTTIVSSNLHLYVVRTQRRDELQKYLEQQEIAALIHYPLTIPQQPFLAESYGELDLPVAQQLTNEILSLPCHPQLTDQEVQTIITSVSAFFTP
jgi:dTDP-4-amino-4,6-dideoxygalactose transaminase